MPKSIDSLQQSALSFLDCAKQNEDFEFETQLLTTEILDVEPFHSFSIILEHLDEIT